MDDGPGDISGGKFSGANGAGRQSCPLVNRAAGEHARIPGRDSPVVDGEEQGQFNQSRVSRLVMDTRSL